MIMIFIASLLAILSFGGFAVSYQVNGINRTIIFLPISLIENSTDVNEKNKTPYFNKEKLINNLSYYLNSNITKYTSDFTFYFTFYNLNNHSFCVTSECTSVEVEFTAKLMYEYTYKRVMYYNILETWYG